MLVTVVCFQLTFITLISIGIITLKIIKWGNIMSDFERGCFFTVCAVVLFLSGIGIGFIVVSKSITMHCVTYNMATIDHKVYNCTLKEVK